MCIREREKKKLNLVYCTGPGPGLHVVFASYAYATISAPKF